MLEISNSRLKSSTELFSYWRSKLADSPLLLDLPTDKSRQLIITDRSEIHNFCLAQQLVNSLQTISEGRDVDLSVTLLAIFKVLVYRYADRQDILVGTPTSHEHGLTTDLLVFRTDLSGNPTFLQVIERTRQVVAAAYDHRDLGFDRLIELLELETSPSYHPLVQVMFSWAQSSDDVRGRSQSPENVKITPAKSDLAQSTPLDLSLHLKQSETGISGQFKYSPDLFDPATIERLTIHFQTLIASIIANPDRSIDQLNILSDSERQQLLVGWNQTQTNYPHQCIHQLFEAQVARTPDQIAVVFEQSQLTYRELNERSNQLAHYLRTKGVGKNVLVGLYLERSLHMVIGLWGILKAGGAYVPLDPAYPKDRVAYILADSQAKVLIADPHLLTSLPQHQAEIVSLTQSQAEIDRQPRSNPTLTTDPADLAYVIYTSGSTGNPKGVEVCHQSQANLLAHLQHTPGLTSSDTLLAVTTICFDTSTADMYLPLVVGAKIVLVSSEVAADGFQLLAQLTGSGATFLQATPVSFRLLLAAGWQGSPTLRVVSTGEALARDLADALLDKVAELWDLYGPTETTVWSTGAKINGLRRVNNYQGALELIGKPIANTQAYILDRYLQPVPIGVPGELHIGGDCLARGYHNLPELTAAKFIPNPFSDEPTARLYKTGDLTRYLADGNIEYIGRIDNQIKIRGFRIELSEIEGLLAKHSAVKQVAAMVREDRSTRRLVAYVVAKTAQKPTVKSLREFLAAKLPDYMIPAAFVFLDLLPLTPNGKIDRRALPMPSYTRQLDNAFVASQDDVELQLTKMWEQALDVRPVGVEDNFFDLGGHSLIAVKLLSEIDRVWHQKLPLATFIAAPTIIQFAHLLRQSSGSTSWPSLVKIESNGSRPPLFCIHPVGGNVLEYYPLADQLGSDQPLYGIQSQGLDGIQSPLTQIEVMAANYITEIQSVQPDGPYLLVGYSFGGLVAFEIAHQLLSQGKKVSLLALLDTESPSLSNIRPALSTTIAIHLRNLQQLKLPSQIKYIKDRIVFRLMYQHKKSSQKEFMLDNWDVELPPVYRRVMEANFQAGIDYVGKFYPGKITLFRSSIQPITQFLHPDLGWSDIAETIEVFDVQGYHSDLLKDPYIQALAQKLQLCVDQLLGESQ